VQDSDGKPVEGAEVHALPSGRVGGAGPALTGADGRFRLTDATPGQWKVVATAEGRGHASEQVVVEAGREAEVVLRLGSNRGRIEGTVTGLTAAELERCRVSTSGGASSMVNADGSFTLVDLRPGDYQVTAQLFPSARSRSVEAHLPEGDAAVTVAIDFASGLVLSGSVRRAGLSVPGLVVTALGVGRRGGGSTVTDADGAWQIAALETGEYAVAARDRAGQVLAGESVVVERDAVLDLDVPAAALAGRVLAADTRAPVEGAQVVVTRSGLPEVRRLLATDADGRFSAAEMPDGDYVVRADASGRAGAQQALVVADGHDAEVTLLLEPDRRTVLVVHEADGRVPPRIWATPMMAGQVSGSVNTVCDPDGHCAFDAFPSGQFTLLVTAEGMALTALQAPGPEVAVALRSSGTLTVSAPPDASGALWRVRLVDQASGLVIPVDVWQNPGRTEWVPVPVPGLRLRLPAGSVMVEGVAPDGASASRTAVVPAGGEVTVRLGGE
jgi:hypothetical protein